VAPAFGAVAFGGLVFWTFVFGADVVFVAFTACPEIEDFGAFGPCTLTPLLACIGLAANAGEAASATASVNPVSRP